jgi:cytochrome c553
MNSHRIIFSQIFPEFLLTDCRPTGIQLGSFLGAACGTRRRPDRSTSGDYIKMNKWLVFAAVFALSGSMPQAFAAGDAAAGKAASATCAGCHGPDGNSANPEWPKLAGQGDAYLVKQLHNFKNGDRQNVTMAPMAMGLSDQDMENLAAYFSSMTMSQGAADKALVEQGEKIYRGGNPASGLAACIGCHVPTGAGNPAAKFPRLGGQHSKYVENQLLAFRSGERNNDAGKMMRTIASKMTDKEIQAVASYVEGLH